MSVGGSLHVRQGLVVADAPTGQSVALADVVRRLAERSSESGDRSLRRSPAACHTMRYPRLPECFAAYIAVSAAYMSCSDVRRSPRATTTPTLAVTDAVAAETVKG